jgi:DNA mismatch endonuclease (patch repair protein)
VFVDGCFWHSCPDHRVFPKNNRDWWRDKLERNVARDREKDAQLDLMGWVVVHVWEHDDPAVAADAIERLWRSRRQLAARHAGPRPLERDV